MIKHAEPANDFETFMGLILAKLYEERGKRPHLSAEDFGLLQPNEVSPPDEWARVEVWQNTFKWLEAEGYVRHEALAGGSFSEDVYVGCELTERGFRVLNSLPPGLKERADQRSLGAQLVELGKKAGWRAATKGAEMGADQATHRIVDLVQHWFT